MEAAEGRPWKVAKITPLGYLCLQLPLDLKPAAQKTDVRAC